MDFDYFSYHAGSSGGVTVIKRYIFIILLALLVISGCKNKGDSMTAVIETSQGTIEVELDSKSAPETVDNFIKYAKSGYYDGTIFHRVMKGFMIQGGGFTPDGNQKKTRPPIRLESGLKNTIGTIAMARTSEPDSATSQFFINTANNPFLDHTENNDGYAVFGKVVTGMDVVKKIESAKTASRGPFDDWPVQDIVIKKVYMK